MLENIPWYEAALLIGIASSTYAGIAAYRLNPKGKANRVFLWIGIIAALWNLIAYLRSFPLGAEIAVLLIKIQFSIGIAAGGGVLDLLQSFSSTRYNRALNYIPSAALGAVILLTGLVVKQESAAWFTYAGAGGEFLWLLQAYLILFVVWGGAMSVAGWRKLSDKGKKYFGGIMWIISPVIALTLFDSAMILQGIPFPNITNAAIGPVDLVAVYIFMRYKKPGGGKEKARGNEARVMAFFGVL